MFFLRSFALVVAGVIITLCENLPDTLSVEEQYEYCDNIDIYGEEIEIKWKKLESCHVIEGHLRIHRCSLPKGASLPNLIQVTDYIILERVQELESLSMLFPRLSVIRGQNLFFDKYAFILNSNLYLEEIGPWSLSLSSIMNGAVHIEDNVFLCTDEELDWNKLISDDYRRFNFFKNNKGFCPFMGCEEEGYCKVREKTCKTLGLVCANVTDRECDSECIGGCYKPSDPSACSACRNFQYMSGGRKNCTKECPKKYLNYMNYRCISEDDCYRKNYSVLNPEDKAFLDEKILPKDLTGKERMYLKYKNDVQCIKDCPEKFIQYHDQSSDTQKKIRSCRLKQVCETTIIINQDLGDNLKYCDHVDGNLIIFVAGGKNVTQQLEENLKNIERVSGYVKVAGADALYSLSFLSNLKLIEGKEVVNGGEYHEGYAFYLVENSNLKQLWDWNFRPKNLTIRGSVYIHFNDRLCDSEISKFLQVAKIKNRKISNGTNGMSAPCNVFHTNLKAVPGSRNGSIMLSWMHNYCGVDNRIVYGYKIFYRAVDKNISKYQERDVCNDHRLFKTNLVKLKLIEEPICMEMELKCLTPNTRYAIYVESLALDNVKYQIESSIVYETTYNDNIEKPSKGKLKLEKRNISLSWEHPKVPSYIVPENISYEILLTLDGDPVQDLVEGGVAVQESDCNCNSLSRSAYFIKQQKTESIVMNNDISSILYYRRKNNTKFLKREKRSSSSRIYDEHDPCGLRSYRIPSWRDYKNKTCDTKMANLSDCEEPKVNWSSSSLRFKKAILESSWKLEDNTYRKSERTNTTTVSISLPDGQYMPKKISVQIRACVGEEIRPCQPLNIDESCSVCSDFLSFDRLTIDNSLPKFEVKLWEETDSNNSGHKTQYASCMDISNSPPLTYVHKTSLDRIEGIENGHILHDELNNVSTMTLSKNDASLSVLNISWTESSDFSDFILGYRIIYYNIDNAEKRTIEIYIPKSEAQKRGNRYKVTVETSLKKYVGFQIHYKGGFGNISEKCCIINIQNEASGYLIYLICIVFAVLGTLSMAAVYKFSKEIWGALSHSKQLNKVMYTGNFYKSFQQFDEKFRINRDQLDVNTGEKLGKGFFGNIYKGTVKKKDVENSSETVIHVAVKTFNRERIENFDAFEELLQEAIKMQEFDCFFVVKLIAISLNYIIFDRPSFCIAMELLDTDLECYLKDLKEGNLSEKEMVEILSQVSIGMSYLHDEKQFIHRDLAARNILLQHISTAEGPSFIAKVADFGLSRSLTDDYMYFKERNRFINVRWAAPEVLMNSGSSFESDIWSFGVLIYEIVTKYVPYSKYRNEEVKELVPIKEIKLLLPANCSQFLRSVMAECLEFNREERTTFANLVDKLLSSEILTKDFRTWLKSHNYIHNCGSVDSKSDSLIDDNYISASTLEPCENEMDDESDYDDHACLAPKECVRNQSSCMSINCVHNTLFGSGKRFSNSDIDDISYRQDINY